MNSIGDILQKKADEIDSGGKRDDLQLLQKELSRIFGDSLQVQKIYNGKALVTTKSASTAANLRMQQHQLIEDLTTQLQNALSGFIIRIE